MTNLDLQYAFELETNSIDAYLTTKLKSDDIIYWLNAGLDKFVKTRFDGDNKTGKSFEQNEKRARDLITMTKVKLYDLTNSSSYKSSRKGYDIYTIVYPEDLMFVLDENVDICGKNDSVNDYWSTDIFECTLDNYMFRITNKLTDFHFRNNYARPLRVRTKDGCELFTDGNYNIVYYSVKYIKNPAKISLDEPFGEYKDLSDSSLREVVKLAVQMYIASLNDPRYNTISTENSTME